MRQKFCKVDSKLFFILTNQLIFLQFLNDRRHLEMQIQSWLELQKCVG